MLHIQRCQFLWIMTTYTQIMYQIVFSTKSREPTLDATGRVKLFKYITGIIQKKNCFMYIINGVEDHIHILTHLHPSVALADLVKEIKNGSTIFIKEEQLFPRFRGWQAGYGAFTYSINARDRLVAYIENQEKHHAKKQYLDEYIALLDEHDLELNPDYP